MKPDDVAVYHEYDPYLLVCGAPHRQGHSHHFEDYRLNSLGFRSPEVGEKRAYRMVVIGGSTVWGSGASTNEATFPAQLERLLKEEHGFSCEVINAGVGSYFSFQELVLTVHRLVYLEPDLVIFFNGYNDIFFTSRIPEHEYQYNEVQTYRTLREFLHHSTAGKDFGNVAPLRTEVARLVRRIVAAGLPSQALRRWMRRLRTGDAGIVSELLGTPEFYAVNRKGTTNYLTNMAMATDILSGRAVEVVIAMQPYLPLSRKQLSNEEEGFMDDERAKRGKTQAFATMYRQMQEGLDELARKKSVTVYRFLDVFDDETRTCFADHVHPNDLGYRLIAARFAALLGAMARSEPQPQRP